MSQAAIPSSSFERFRALRDGPAMSSGGAFERFRANHPPPPVQGPVQQVNPQSAAIVESFQPKPAPSPLASSMFNSPAAAGMDASTPLMDEQPADQALREVGPVRASLARMGALAMPMIEQTAQTWARLTENVNPDGLSLRRQGAMGRPDPGPQAFSADDLAAAEPLAARANLAEQAAGMALGTPAMALDPISIVTAGAGGTMVGQALNLPPIRAIFGKVAQKFGAKAATAIEHAMASASGVEVITGLDTLAHGGTPEQAMEAMVHAAPFAGVFGLAGAAHGAVSRGAKRTNEVSADIADTPDTAQVTRPPPEQAATPPPTMAPDAITPPVARTPPVRSSDPPVPAEAPPRQPTAAGEFAKGPPDAQRVPKEAWQQTSAELERGIRRDIPRPLPPAVKYGERIYKATGDEQTHPAILGRVEELGRPDFDESKLSYGFTLSDGSFVPMDANGIGKAGHRRVVEVALAEGRPVPPEVLADYPDLKPATTPPNPERGGRDFRLPGPSLVTQPMAAEGLTSYRYRTISGSHVAIGAKTHAGAMREAARSITGAPEQSRLDVWDGREYVPVSKEPSSARTYSEQSAHNAVLWLDPKTQTNVRPELWTATDPALATGQGANKGVRLEFEGLEGKPSRTKPSAAFAEAQGMAELTAGHNTPEAVRDSLRSITVDWKAVAGDPMHRRLKVVTAKLKREGWTEATEGGATVYRKPSLAEAVPVVKGDDAVPTPGRVGDKDGAQVVEVDAVDRPGVTVGKLDGIENLNRSKVEQDAVPVRPARIGNDEVGHAKPPVADSLPDPDARLTSARKAMTTEDRAAMGLDELPSPERRSWETDLADAREQGIPDKALRIAAEVSETPRALSSTETAGLVDKATDLKNQHAKAMDAVNKATDPADVASAAAEAGRIEGEFDVLTKALRASGTEKGRALAAQKLTLDQDFNLVSVKNRAKAAKGSALTPEQAQKFETLTKELEATNAKVAELEKAMSEQSAERAIRRHKAGRKSDPKAHAAEFGDLLAKAKALLKAGCD